MQRRIAISVFIAMIIVSGTIGESRDRVIRIGAAGGGMAPTVVAREILTEAYSRIGYRTEYLEYPPNRMIASFISGQIDALVIAEASFSEDYPNSIRIETPIWVDELVAFTKAPLPIQGWESMRAYRIGYISAMLIIEKNLSEGFVTFPVKDSVQLFRMLDVGRIDVVITSRAVGELTIANLGLKNMIRVEKPLAIVPNYHYLSKGNADIARKLSAVLEKMDRSGRIDEITEETLVRLFPSKGK